MTPVDYADKSVLIVDDSTVNLGVLVDYLQEVGFRTFTARDGEAAVERAALVNPDIILLDIMMPGIDGFETCRRLKANETIADIPVIFMTALNETKDKVAGFAVGAVDYITKPIQQEELLARMTTHLRIYDLTARLQSANDQLTQQAQQLSESNATKDRLFSIIAHDLRGLFLPLLGFTDLLSRADTYQNVQSAQRMAERAHGAAQSIYYLLEKLLNWANLEQGQIPFQPACIDLPPVVEAALKLVNENARRKNITLVSTVDDTVQVYADAGMIETVLLNLLSNAIKFTPPSGTVTVAAQAVTADFVEVCVIDTGVGISPEDQQKLFDVSTNHVTTGTGNERGVGLGLVICKEMVEKHHGRIALESAPNQGTTAKFTLPATDAQLANTGPSHNPHTA